MRLILASVLVVLGLAAPRLAGDRETTTWFLWFLRRMFRALCFGAALGVLLSAILGK